MRACKTIFAALGLVLAATGSANAAAVQLQFNGLTLTYSQSTGLMCTGANGVCGVDPLLNVTFILDNVVLGEFDPSDINFAEATMDLPNGTNPSANATIALTPNTGSFDVEAGVSSLATNLATNITSGSVTFSNGSLNAIGSGSIIPPTNLPFGLVANNPINWSFSAGLSACSGTAGSLVCNYSGTGELAWATTTTLVTDGGTALSLLGLALVGLGAVRRLSFGYTRRVQHVADNRP